MLWQGSVNHLGLIEGRRHCARPTNIYRYFMFPVYMTLLTGCSVNVLTFVLIIYKMGALFNP